MGKEKTPETVRIIIDDKPFQVPYEVARLVSERDQIAKIVATQAQEQVAMLETALKQAIPIIRRSALLNADGDAAELIKDIETEFPRLFKKQEK